MWKKDGKKKNKKINNNEYISRKEFFIKFSRYALAGSVSIAALSKNENLHASSIDSHYSETSSFFAACPAFYTMPFGGENVGNNHDPLANKPDPVNARTGNNLLNITDFSISGMLVDLKFTRAYNSRLDYRGPFGNKWTHNYNHRLYDKGDFVDYFHGKGYIFRFKYSGNQYISPAGFKGILNKNGKIYTLNIQNQIKLFFNEYGLFTKVTENKVNSININYDNEYKLANIVDTRGRKILFEYDSAGRILKVTLPDNRYYRYFYEDGNDNLTKVTDNNDNKALYVYDANHNLTSKYDSKMPAGFNEVTIAYDGNNRFKVMKDTYKNIIASAIYDGNINTFTDAGGTSRIYEFDAMGNLIKLTNEGSKTTKYRYDANRNLMQIKQTGGKAVKMAYSNFNQALYTNGFWRHTWVYL
jgi:YD repeat-containing protein